MRLTAYALGSLTQAKLARSLHVKQEQVSRIELRTDLHISTLRRRVQAMGGERTIPLPASLTERRSSSSASGISKRMFRAIAKAASDRAAFNVCPKQSRSRARIGCDKPDTFYTHLGSFPANLTELNWKSSDVEVLDVKRIVFNELAA